MLYDIQITKYDPEITYFTLCFFAFCAVTYLFCKSRNMKRLRESQWLYVFIAGIALSVMYTYLRCFSNQLPQFIMYFSIPLLVSVLDKDNKFTNNLAASLISLGLFQAFKAVSTIIVTTVFFAFGINVKIILAHFASMVVSFILCILFMRIKRFKAGFQFFQQDAHLGLGLAISGISIMLNSFSLEGLNDTDILYLLVILGAIIISFGLYLWIRRSITARYREKMQLKSEEYYQQMLAEKEEEIAKLNQTNEYLAKIIHRDNHLLSSLNTSIDAYYSGDDETFKDDMLRGIQTLAKERNELIEREQLVSKLFSSTGNVLIDGAVNDLYIKAAAHGINFDLTVSETVDKIVGKFISQTDLQTLLCDHIKDAVIAVDARGDSQGNILVSLSQKNDIYDISIFDSGVDFEIDTFSKLGLERTTTHAGDGGSGFGFMTTFETLKKAYATLVITEFENKTPFSKSVSFRFDGESAFIIHSYRAAELKEKIRRDDVVIL